MTNVVKKKKNWSREILTPTRLLSSSYPRDTPMLLSLTTRSRVLPNNITLQVTIAAHRWILYLYLYFCLLVFHTTFCITNNNHSVCNILTRWVCVCYCYSIWRSQNVGSNVADYVMFYKTSGWVGQTIRLNEICCRVCIDLKNKTKHKLVFFLRHERNDLNCFEK